MDHSGEERPNLPPALFGHLDYIASRMAGYAARSEWRSLLQEIRDPHRLEHFGRKIYSQNDEDGILEEIFRRLQLEPHSGQFVEFGVDRGVECNTHYLLHRGFSGLWMEGSEGAVRDIRRRFGPALEEGQLRLAHAFITAQNINDLLATHVGGDRKVVLLSIDIDGNDFWVWQSIATVMPAVVVIEYNAKFPPPISIAQEYKPEFAWSGSDYFGASLEALDRLGHTKGYRLVGCNITGSNAFFVRSDLVAGHFPYALTARHLYHPCRYHLTDDCFRRMGHPPDFGRYVRIDESSSALAAEPTK